MGKIQYTQNFRVDWLRQNEFKSWLKDIPSDSSKAFCKICCCELRARRADLLNHMETKKHKSSIQVLRIHPPNTIKPNITSLNTCRAEAALAMFVSAHCALLSVDHLGTLCKSHFSGTNNTADNLRLHRTKCTAIIKNVLSPYFQNNLKDDIGNGRFSILVDESTDISVIKYLGICRLGSGPTDFGRDAAGRHFDRRRGSGIAQCVRSGARWPET